MKHIERFAVYFTSSFCVLRIQFRNRGICSNRILRSSHEKKHHLAVSVNIKEMTGRSSESGSVRTPHLPTKTKEMDFL